jgi:hypothetical protein
VRGEEIEVANEIKYLGIILDSKGKLEKKEETSRNFRENSIK